MAYPMIDETTQMVDETTQGQYPKWSAVRGYIYDPETKIYRWADPVTGDIVKSVIKPGIPDLAPEVQQEVTRRGLTDFIVDKSGRVLSREEMGYRYTPEQQPQQEQPSFLKEAMAGIENADEFEFQKSKRQWISEESAYDMGIDVDGSRLPQLGPDTITRMKEQAYQRFQMRDQERRANYAELKMKVNQIDKDPYANDIEKRNAARSLISPHLPNIPETREEGYGEPPWYMSPEFSGTEQGRIAGGLEPRISAISASTKDPIDAIKIIQQLANDIEKLYTNKPKGTEWVGLARGPYRGLVRRTKGIGKDEEEFRRNTNMVGQLLGYALSGKQLNAREIELLQESSPQLNLPPQTFKSNIIAFKKLLNQMLIQRQKGLAGAGYNVGNSQNAQPTGLTPEEQDELAELRREAQR